MQIIMCDNNTNDLDKLEKKVHHYFQQHPDREYTVVRFQNPKSLIFELDDEAKGDLYILDIDMPGVDGLKLSKIISDRYPYVAVFFYTSFLEYAVDGYRADAKRFLLKDGNSEIFAEAMDFACQFYDKFEHDCITLQYYHDFTKIPKKEIMYVEKEKRILHIHTSTQGIRYDNRGIQKFFEIIDDPKFVFINRGLFVNVSYIQQTDHDEITLFNGDTLYIGIKKIPEVKAAIMHNWHLTKE